MIYYWLAAYVQSQSQEQILDDIRKTDFWGVNVKLVLNPADVGRPFNHVAQRWRLVFLTPDVNGWIGMLGSTPAFYMQVFRKNKYSGLILEMIDDEHWRLWSYQVWENGVLVDWFITQPVNNFDVWAISTLEEVVMPYLALKNMDQMIEDISDELPESIGSAFNGELTLLKEKHLLTDISQLNGNSADKNETVADLFSPTPEGFEEFLSFLNLPYARLDYNPVDLGIYHDVKRGRVDLSKQAQYYTDTFNHTKSLPDVDKLSWIALEIDKKDEIKILFWNFFN